MFFLDLLWRTQMISNGWMEGVDNKTKAMFRPLYRPGSELFLILCRLGIHATKVNFGGG